jgi:hypothetical protein
MSSPMCVGLTLCDSLRSGKNHERHLLGKLRWL